MTIKIEKGIPVPPKEAGRIPMYPWASMDVGDSFWARKSRNAVSAGASREGKARGHKYIVRVERDGVRCWRIA